MVKGNVPTLLSGKRVLKLESASFFRSDTNAKAAVLIESIIDELVAQRNIILFVDELDNFVGNTQASEKLHAALQQNKSRLRRRLESRYSEKIEKQAELAALFTLFSSIK